MAMNSTGTKLAISTDGDSSPTPTIPKTNAIVEASE